VVVVVVEVVAEVVVEVEVVVLGTMPEVAWGLMPYYLGLKNWKNWKKWGYAKYKGRSKMSDHSVEQHAFSSFRTQSTK
jgi:hypothetical protein